MLCSFDFADGHKFLLFIFLPFLWKIRWNELKFTTLCLALLTTFCYARPLEYRVQLRGILINRFLQKTFPMFDYFVSTKRGISRFHLTSKSWLLQKSCVNLYWLSDSEGKQNRRVKNSISCCKVFKQVKDNRKYQRNPLSWQQQYIAERQ